jgi:exopolyphosphatase/guanosine-5'-triphosphate,3'-diphosphate pyrophosphatase
MKIQKYAAIDIGSNAIRLLFMNVIRNGDSVLFRKSSIIRVPVRLGDSVFRHSVIPPQKIDKLIHTMTAFHHLMKVQEVVAYRACATSAMREAKNGMEVIDKVRQETGIQIEILSGFEEAGVIYHNGMIDILPDKKNYLFVDVGGGSTEITLFSNHQVVDSRSFNVGTLRILSHTLPREEKQEMKIWIKKIAEVYDDIEMIGSGGNINKFFKISRRKEGKPLSYYHLLELFDKLEALGYENRIKLLGLNPDRSDVIIPAGEIFLSIMRWAGCKKIWIPKTGLADGMIRLLYEKHSQVN